MENTYFRVFSGLMTPEHQKRIGNALWVFLWMIDRTTKDETGAVYYGNPVSYSLIGDELGIDKSTVRRYCETLAKAGYISMKRTTRGYKYHVMKSKKWGDVSVMKGTNIVTNDTEGVKNTTQDNKDRVNDDTKGVTNDTEGVKNDHSILQDNINNNKQDKKIKEKEADALSSESSFERFAQEILNEFTSLRGTGLFTSPSDHKAAMEIAESNMSLSDAKQYMQECFDKYQPKHSKDRIQSLGYCVGYILDRHTIKNNAGGQAAFELAEEFLGDINKVLDDFTQPDLNYWSMHMQKLLDAGKSVERITEVMKFARGHKFWTRTVLHPTDLAKHFEKLAMAAKTDKQPKRKNEHKDDLPKWMLEERQKENEPAPIPLQNQRVASNEKSFDEMLAELRSDTGGDSI